MIRRLLLLVRRLRKAWASRDVSEHWLREQERASSRNTYEGCSWSWPIRKQRDEAGQFNSARLRKRA